MDTPVRIARHKVDDLSSIGITLLLLLRLALDRLLVLVRAGGIGLVLLVDNARGIFAPQSLVVDGSDELRLDPYGCSAGVPQVKKI